MSFTQVPNEALDRMTEISAGALRLYLFLLRCRNQTTGKCCPSVQVTAEGIDVHPKNVFKLRNELTTAGWAHFTGDSVSGLLGVKSSKNATTDGDSKRDTPRSSKNATILAKGSKNTTAESQKHYPEVAKTLLDSSKNATAYKEEQYEGTILSEQYELIPVAIAPGSFSRQECYDLFVELRATVGQYEAPYQNQTADFVHLAKLFKNCERTNWTLTREKFTQAATHYFATPQKVHTLADLATRFSEFYKSAFDKFGNPVGGNGRDTPMSLLTPAAQKTVAALESWLKQGEESEGT